MLENIIPKSKQWTIVMHTALHREKERVGKQVIEQHHSHSSIIHSHSMNEWMNECMKKRNTRPVNERDFLNRILVRKNNTELTMESGGENARLPSLPSRICIPISM